MSDLHTRFMDAAQNGVGAAPSQTNPDGSLRVDFDQPHRLTPAPAFDLKQGASLRALDRAVRDLREAGYEVPARTGRVRDNLAELHRMPAPPAHPDLSLPADRFSRALATYLTEFARHTSERTARAAVVADSVQVLREAATADLDDVLSVIRADFATAAEEFASAHARVREYPTVGAAASGDLDGSLVASWHARDRAAQALGKLANLVDSFSRICFKSGGSLPTEWHACLVADVDAGRAGRVRQEVEYTRTTSIPDHLVRWTTLAELGYTLDLAQTVDQWRTRVSVATNPADDDDDSDELLAGQVGQGVAL